MDENKKKTDLPQDEDNEKDEDKEVKKQENENYKEKTEEYLNGWKRCLADFDNYKKQQVKFFEEMRQYATEDLIRDIIPILDGFELALRTIPEEDRNKEWRQGVVYIKSQLEDVLKTRGLEHITVVGEMFDPALHEAVESMPQEGAPTGKILEELQKGYVLYGKVIRPARVRVAT